MAGCGAPPKGVPRAKHLLRLRRGEGLASAAAEFASRPPGQAGPSKPQPQPVQAGGPDVDPPARSLS